MRRSKTATSTTPSWPAACSAWRSASTACARAVRPAPLEVWMEELYRRVSDRQTMGSVVQELRASLSEVEKQIDQFFRNPAQREVLIPVPGQLSSMRGVLSVLGMDQASQAVLRMRDDVDALIAAEVDATPRPHQAAFERLADNLGALGFLIDMLSVQPQMAKSLFLFDAGSRQPDAVMGRAHRPSAFGAFDELPAADQAPGRAGADAIAKSAAAGADAARQSRESWSCCRGRPWPPTSAASPSAADKAHSARWRRRLPATSAERRCAQAAQADDRCWPSRAPTALPSRRRAADEAAAAAAAAARRRRSAPSTGLEDDAEMREIFLEEAREVMQTPARRWPRWRRTRTTSASMTTVRRAFHTLKGSSRMVGLQGLRRGRLGLRAALQRPPGRQRPLPTDDLLGLQRRGAGLPGRLDRRHRQRRHRRLPATARSAVRPTRMRNDRRRIPVQRLALPASTARWRRPCSRPRRARRPSRPRRQTPAAAGGCSADRARRARGGAAVVMAPAAEPPPQVPTLAVPEVTIDLDFELDAAARVDRGLRCRPTCRPRRLPVGELADAGGRCPRRSS